MAESKDYREKNILSEKSKLWHLKEINLLEGLPDRILKRIADNTTMQQVRKGAVIYFPEVQRSNVYFLKNGHVKITRLSREGRQAIMDIVGPGEIFGELALSEGDEDEYVELAEALDDVLVCVMAKLDFLELLAANPKLNLRMLKWMGLKLRSVESRVEDLIFKNVRERIITFLLHSAESFGTIKSGEIRIPKFLSQAEIAYMTSASRQSVATILNELRQEHLIDFSTKSLTICKPELLRSEII